MNDDERLEKRVVKTRYYMSRVLRNLTVISNVIQQKPDCSTTKDSQKFRILVVEECSIYIAKKEGADKQRGTAYLTSPFFSNTQWQVISWRGSYVPVRHLVNYNGHSG